MGDDCGETALLATSSGDDSSGSAGSGTSCSSSSKLKNSGDGLDSIDTGRAAAASSSSVVKSGSLDDKQVNQLSLSILTSSSSHSLIDGVLYGEQSPSTSNEPSLLRYVRYFTVLYVFLYITNQKII